MKETHNNMCHLLSAVNYQEHKWLICSDIKVVELVLGPRGGDTKYPCFLCLWDGRSGDKHDVSQELI